jgi:RNA polymerase sigma factor (sigma-70 family)
VTSQAEIIFRREWGRAVAVVTRLTGDLGLAEDAVQDAFASAVGRWASGPLPSDPSGWLITVAKNHATDRLRREARRSGKEQAAMLMLGQRDPAPPPGRIADDQLRLIFACCHPALDPGTRVALTLRTLCGLSAAEIARSFLVSEATLAQRLVRAKRKIRAAGIPFRIPADEDLPGRIGGVLRVVYLVFTEGHQASTGSPGEVADALYAGKKAPLRPLHDELMAMVYAMGPDVSLAPKKGYVSLRRPGKQFAMIQPSGAGRIDLGLILPGVPPADRLEPSGSFNALFTHRVRVTSASDLDDALAGWLAAAYAAAG